MIRQGRNNLSDAIRELNLDAQLDLEGRWARLRGRCCDVFVVELDWGRGHGTWCDHPLERAVEFHHDPRDAIRVGMRRACRACEQRTEEEHGH